MNKFNNAILILFLSVTGLKSSAQTILVKDFYDYTNHEYVSPMRSDNNGNFYFFIRKDVDNQRSVTIYKTDGTTNNTIEISKQRFVNSVNLIEGAGGVVYFTNDSCNGNNCKYYLRAFNSNNNTWSLISELQDHIQGEFQKKHIIINGWFYYIQKEGIFRTSGQTPEKILNTDAYNQGINLYKLNHNLIITGTYPNMMRVFNTTTSQIYEVAASTSSPSLELKILHMFEIDDTFYVINIKKDENNVERKWISKFKFENDIILGIEYLHNLKETEASLPYPHIQTGVSGGKFFFSSYDKLFIYNPTTNDITELLDQGMNSIEWFFPFNQEMFFLYKNNLWKSNGTPSGTVMINTPFEQNTGNIYVNISGSTGQNLYKSFSIYNNRLFYIGKRESGEPDMGWATYGLRSTDGTPGSTLQEDNITQSFSFYEMRVLDDNLLVMCRVDKTFQLRKYAANNTHVSNTFNFHDIEIFPNPTSDIINIHSNIPLDNAVVSIYNFYGTLVHQEQLCERQSISTNNLQQGVYFVKIKSAGSNILKKITIVR